MDNPELKERLQWLIRLRWAGCVGIFIAAHFIREVFGLDFPMLPVYIILGAVIIYNLYSQRRLQFISENLLNNAILQISLDYITLAAAIYFSGGCDSPFLYYYIFHIVITGVILPPKWTFRFTALAVILPGGVLGLKHIGLLPHVSIFRDRPVFFADIEVIFIYGSVFISTLLLTAYLVTYLSDKLYKKQNEIKSLYAAQSNFIANLSHEVKSPINAVMGFMSLMSAGTVSPEDRDKYRTKIEDTANYINSLLNDIMELSKIEVGRVSLSIAPFRIADIIRDSADMLFFRANERNIEVSVEAEDIKEVFCCGDERRVRQIIVNLLDNAIKYTPEGGRIGVKAKRVNDSVEVTIWDTGRGIDAANIAKVFDAYKRFYEEEKVKGQVSVFPL